MNRQYSSMSNHSSIQKWANQLARQFQPEKIILFGSHAYGKPGKGSDVDLFIIMRHQGPSIKMASEIRLALPADVPVDVVVRTPEKVKKRLEMNDFFIRDVISNGIVLYASSHS